VISDGHTGHKTAIARVFEATWQGDRVRWITSAPVHVPGDQNTDGAPTIRQALDQPDRIHAWQTWGMVVAQLRPRWPKLADLLGAGKRDVQDDLSFLRQHRA
jgi:transposase-like protein